MKELRLFNTLTGAVEPLVPEVPPALRMYVCGPTVYGRAHIGNFRTFVATDILRRTLKHLGLGVREVMNLTDVEDRIIQFAREAGCDLRAFTAPHIAAFEEDMAALRMERPEVFPKATEHVPDMVRLVEDLGRRGHTYAVDGSVYFRISTFPEYGRLSRLDTA
ncbi:MAG TPA: cysteine--tRNA ligase, partial [Vicinamibacteria bacterium]